MAEQITFDQLPSAVTELLSMVRDLQKTVASLSENTGTSDKWFSLDEFCEYHPGKPKKPTVYKWVSERLVPHIKQGNRLAFKKSLIDKWLNEQDRKTISEIEAGATDSLKSKKSRK